MLTGALPLSNSSVSEITNNAQIYPTMQRNVSSVSTKKGGHKISSQSESNKMKLRDLPHRRRLTSEGEEMEEFDTLTQRKCTTVTQPSPQTGGRTENSSSHDMTCPFCKKDFRHLPLDQFQFHVFECYDDPM